LLGIGFGYVAVNETLYASTFGSNPPHFEAEALLKYQFESKSLNARATAHVVVKVVAKDSVYGTGATNAFRLCLIVD
jgi:hypothetical protein